MPTSMLRNLRFVLPLAVVNTTGYLVLNNHPLFARHPLELTAIDRATPFLVWTIWPYLVLLFADVVVPLFVRDRALFHRMLLAYAVAILTNFTIWALFPTVLERPPLPIDGGVSAWAYRVFVGIDAAGNCFPSGHITIPAVAVWALTRERPNLSITLWPALLLLSLTILTTRQHYLVDLLGGFGTAALGIAASAPLQRFVSRRLAPQPST